MNTQNNNLKYLVALSVIGNSNLSATKKIYGRWKHNLSDLFHTKRNTLEKLNFPAQMIEAIQHPPWAIIDKNLAWLDQSEHHLVTIEDADYPEMLKEISTPPLLLFVLGNKSLLNAPQLAIVGSRNPTATGKENAFAFAKKLANSGFTITSGLASGIDAHAHAGAYDSPGKTIAVFGTGLDQIYPKTNTALAENIVGNAGALISEFPLGTRGLRHNFPLRNRIISGLSYGTLVIEATIHSGSLITARLATEQGREVFAVPGSIHNPLARGCNSLIRQGAKLVETAADIFSELKHLAFLINNPHIMENDLDDVAADSKKSAKQNHLDPEHKKLLECIGYEMTHIDSIIERSHLKTQEIAAMLLTLELEGFVTNANGGYVRVK